MIELANGIPASWRKATIGEIAQIHGGKPAPQDPRAFAADGIPFVRMKDLGRYHLTDNLNEVDDYLDRDFATAHNLIPIKAGAILMPRSGSVGLNHRAILGIDAVIVSHICALEIRDPAISNEFLYRYLCRVRLDKITKKTTGLDAINFADLRKVEVPIPPIAEQTRIAAILDRADEIGRKRQQMLGLADAFLRSTFLEMFGDPVSNPKKLPISPIKEMGRVVTGNTPPRIDPENYGPGIEWIKSDNIGTPHHFLTDAEETLTRKGQAISRSVPTGSTLVTCIAGSPNSIGNAALADREVAFNQQINAVVPNPGIDPFFLYCQFLVGKRLVQNASTNSMKGMVSKGKFQEIAFLNPNSQSQENFGRMFKQVLRTIGKLRTSCAEDNALIGSLAQRAFRGEL
ncbi:restriction endonuclease subunit S [Bradyrhizobium sp. URHD0069]|uniref:restriction endonuclease subunit S n=1 Tax=Bradyrhizobium sp. URHD0069 TaxID=1380355 RepID=UPI00068A9C9A|nr:restriction endonuclease subunit S [Bradyrhizobium sp. URHD0069]